MRDAIRLAVCLIFTLTTASWATTYTVPTNLVGTIYPSTLSQLDPPGPGDTIIIAPGTRDYLIFDSFAGSTNSPITIKNGDGKVTIDTNTGGSNYACLSFHDCSFLTVSGTGSASYDYGIELRDPTDNGLCIRYESTDIELENIEIHEIPGIGLSILPGDDDGPSYTMYNLSCHDLYIHSVGEEGMYIGVSWWTPDSYLDGVQIYDCVLTDIGWDGIQLSNAIADVDVHDNLVSSFGEYAGAYVGGCVPAGILIAPGTVGSWHRNWISNGKGVGIYVQHDEAGVEVFNNVVADITAHHFSDQDRHYGEGLWWLEGSGEVYNNTIVRTDAEALIVASAMANSGHNLYVHDNIITGYGSHWCSGAPYCDYSSGAATIADNLCEADPDDVDFQNAASDDFHLLSTSDAVNAQSDDYPPVDFDQASRPYSRYADRGAFEYRPRLGSGSPGIRADLAAQIGPWRLRLAADPNPFNPKTELVFDLERAAHVQLHLFDISGRLVGTLVDETMEAGIHHVAWDGTSDAGKAMASGIYFGAIVADGQSARAKLVLLK